MVYAELEVAPYKQNYADAYNNYTAKYGIET
jgi:hypothetical protein